MTGDEWYSWHLRELDIATTSEIVSVECFQSSKFQMKMPVSFFFPKNSAFKQRSSVGDRNKLFTISRDKL